MNKYQFEDSAHPEAGSTQYAELYRASKRRVLAKLCFYAHLAFALLVMGVASYSMLIMPFGLALLIPLGLHFLTAFVYSPYKTRPRKKQIRLNVFNTMVEKEMQNMQSKGLSAEEQWPSA